MFADELAEQGPKDIFAWAPTETCNFLATHNIIAASSELRGAVGRRQTASTLWQPLELHYGNSRDSPRFRIYKCTYPGCA
jgi:hypothetical protein